MEVVGNTNVCPHTHGLWFLLRLISFGNWTKYWQKVFLLTKSYLRVWSHQEDRVSGQLTGTAENGIASASVSLWQGRDDDTNSLFF